MKSLRWAIRLDKVSMLVKITLQPFTGLSTFVVGGSRRKPEPPPTSTPIFCPAKEFAMNVSAIYQWFNRRCLASVILAAAISFLLGFWISDRRLAKKVSESAQGQVKEFVMFADSMGFIDRQKLEEALNAAQAMED